YVLCNKRFDEMFPKTADLRVPGMQFENILRGGVAHGVYHQAVGREKDWIAERLAEHRKPSSMFEQRHTNGMWVRAEDSHLPNGGFVGIRVELHVLQPELLLALLQLGHVDADADEAAVRQVIV